VPSVNLRMHETAGVGRAQSVQPFEGRW
jgi:hypothetical protein